MTFLPWPLSVPVLSDGYVTLRAHHSSDIEPMVEMITDPQSQTWTSVPLEYHERAAEQFLTDVVTPGWDSGSNRIWVVEVEGKFIGQVDLRGDGPIKEIAYMSHPFFRNRGATRAAVRLVLDYAFTEIETDVVHWRARVGNVPSLKVAYSCGFTLHETVPRLLHEHGQLHDAWTGSIAFGEATYPQTKWTENSLASSNVRLRPLRDSDGDRWDEALADPAAKQHLVAVSGALSSEPVDVRNREVQWAAARGRACTWVITRPDSDEFCGLVTVHGIEHQAGTGAELEWILHPAARGQGLMAEAVRLAITHVLDPEGLNQQRVSAFVAASNTASNRVVEKSGGQRFGTQTRSEPLGDGTFDDLHEYEWLQ